MKRILVVEDDADISDAIASCFEDRGHHVIVAANGREALDKLTSGALPDLILLDLMMPVMDGWQFRAAQMADPSLASIPVVLLSAHMDVADAAERMGGLLWLKKPVDLKSLLAALDEACT